MRLLNRDAAPGPRGPGAREIAWAGGAIEAPLRAVQRRRWAGARLAVLAAAFVLLIAAGCWKEPDDKKAARLAAIPWSITGEISVPADHPMAGVFIFIEGTSHVAATDQDGRWTLSGVPSGRYKLRAQREDLEAADLGPLALEPDAAETERKVTLPRTVMSVRTRPIVAEATPIPPGSLRGVVRLPEGSKDFAGFAVQIDGTAFRTLTDDLGEYFFPEIPGGEIKVSFQRPGWKTIQAKTTIQSGSEMPGPIVDMIPLEPPLPPSERTLRGAVKMSSIDGEPLAEFTQTLVSLEGTARVAIPDAQGRFVFQDLPPKPYTLIASAPGFVLREKVDVDLTAIEAAEITIQLVENPEDAKNLGSVVGKATLKKPPKNEDHSGIIVSLTGTNLVAVTAPDGSYALRDVPPGSYLLRAQSEGQAPEFVEDVVAKSGQETKVPDLVLGPQITPPQVLFTSPSNGDRDVTILGDTPAVVRFSKKMRPETVKGAFSIAPSVAVRLYMGREHPQSDFDLLFIQMMGAPKTEGAEPLHFDTTYKVTISEAATDFEGGVLDGPYSFAFTTGAAQIIGSRPSPGETGATITIIEPVVIYFNAQMDHESFSTDDIRVRPDPLGQPNIQPFDDPVSGWTELRVTIPLDTDTQYSMLFSGNWRTADGSKISNLPYRLRFQTAQFKELKPYSGKKERK